MPLHQTNLTLDQCQHVVEREWHLDKLRSDFEARHLSLTALQWETLTLLLCWLPPKEIGALLGRESGAIRNQLTNAIVPKVIALCQLNPEQSFVHSDIPVLLARHGYARSNWLWLQGQAEPAFDRITPLTPKRPALGEMRDIVDASSPMSDRGFTLPQVPVKEVVQLKLEIPASHTLILLNKGTSQSVYCLVPSRYAPQDKQISCVPMERCGAIRFAALGKEEFLAIVSPKRLWLSWLDDEVESSLIRLEEAHLAELSESIKDHNNEVRLYYSAFQVVQGRG